MRTSLTHPLRIDELDCQPQAPGVIGITFCPGKCGDSVHGAPWARDLALDLTVIARWGATAVITLVESHELSTLGVAHLGDAVRRHGMAWHHLPIPDLQAPGAAFQQAAGDALRQTLAALHRGEKVLVHCRGGLGRAGTVAASMLIELGEAPGTALQRVRQARPGAVETPAQAQYLHGYQPWLYA